MARRPRRPGAVTLLGISLIALVACSPAPPQAPGPSREPPATQQPAEVISPTVPATARSAPTPTRAVPELHPAVATLADRIGFTPPARRTLSVTEPALVTDATTLHDACRSASTPPPEGRVLGCFTSRAGVNRIHIWDVSHPELAGTNEVTLAHELLHAAWHALDATRRAALEPVLREVFEQGEPAARLELLTGYRDRDPEVFVDELHSYIGTEVASLPAALEEHYATLFSDRRAVVGLSESSTATLRQRSADLAALDASLAAQSAQIDADTAALEQRRTQRDAQAAALATNLEELDRTDPAAVADHNRRVDEYNADISEDNRLQAELADAVATHNADAEQQRRLVDELNALQESRGLTWD